MGTGLRHQPPEDTAVQPLRFTPESQPVASFSELASTIIAATNAQIKDLPVESEEGRADLRLSTDALNLHRVEWRLREEWGDVDPALIERVKARICKRRRYEAEEFEAALTATRHRPRLPYGWTALDVAVRRLESKPVRLLDADLEASRYAKGILSLAIHLQDIQGTESILLPVEQVREILSAKKVVVAGTITKLVDMGLLELTKEDYHTGSAREYRFKGEEGKDFVFEEAES
jgi:hypothetical protein